jgi:hypothetical protein
LNDKIAHLDFGREESQLVLVNYEKSKKKLDNLMKTWEDKILEME